MIVDSFVGRDSFSETKRYPLKGGRRIEEARSFNVAQTAERPLRSGSRSLSDFVLHPEKEIEDHRHGLHARINNSDGRRQSAGGRRRRNTRNILVNSRRRRFVHDRSRESIVTRASRRAT